MYVYVVVSKTSIALREELSVREYHRAFEHIFTSLLFCQGSIQLRSIMAQTSADHKTHILDFFYDNEDSSALTVLVNDVRFHIIVDPNDLQKSREKPLYYEYLDKISALREADEREELSAERSQSKVSDGKHIGSSDSGIDVTADEDTAEDEDQDSGSASVELRNWILSAFGDIIQQYAPPDREPIDSTLHEWYHGPTYFYSLQIKQGELTPELLETTSDLSKRIENLVPRLKLPKYITSQPLPWLSSHDLTVKSEVSLPEPAHPGEVITSSGETYFFKPVDASQPNTIKREISILQRLAKLDLPIRAPQLLGFVSLDNSKTEAMGFLLTPIKDPKPLTKLLKASVSIDLRNKWSEQAARYVDQLHAHDIIWGDAKADNFIVDADDELWIIDFGGSYTEGWVDPEFSETREGDDMGLEKVRRALADPDANTFDPVGGQSDDGGVQETASSLFVTERIDAGGESGRERRAKRKRAAEEVDDDEEDETEQDGRKRRRSDTQENTKAEEA